MSDRTSLPEPELAARILTLYAKYETERHLADVTIVRLDDTETPNWTARPYPELSGQDHRCFHYALSDVRRDYDLLPAD